MNDTVRQAVHRRLDQAEWLQGIGSDVERAAEATVRALKTGNKILACGNGGSAAQSQHFTGELVGRFEVERSGLAAVPLTADVASITAIANDFGYESVFRRQVEALGRSGDLLYGLSTSGESENVVAAIERARELGVGSVGLTGAPGGSVAEAADRAVVVPATNTARVQEAHLVILHAICAAVDVALEGGAQLSDGGDEA